MKVRVIQSLRISPKAEGILFHSVMSRRYLAFKKTTRACISAFRELSFCASVKLSCPGAVPWSCARHQAPGFRAISAVPVSNLVPIIFFDLSVLYIRRADLYQLFTRVQDIDEQSCPSIPRNSPSVKYEYVRYYVYRLLVHAIVSPSLLVCKGD